ncbi:MAG: VOC family protein [Pseudomonadota bacterium]
MITKLDHIVISAQSRQAGADHLKAVTGAEMAVGGEHTGIGTHNMLCQFGPGIFLESIALNPDAPPPDRPLWYGLNAPKDAPWLSAWVLNTDDVDAAVAAATELGINLGTPMPAQRGDLSWTFVFPDAGNSDLGGAVPYVMKWDQPDQHPSGGMKDAGVSLKLLTVETPDAGTVNKLLAALNFDDNRISVVPGDSLRMIATITTADGRDVTLS